MAKKAKEPPKKPRLKSAQFPKKQFINTTWKRPDVDPAGTYAYCCHECGKLYVGERSFLNHRKTHRDDADYHDFKPATCLVPLHLQDTHVVTESPVAMTYEALERWQGELQLQKLLELTPRLTEINKRRDEITKEIKDVDNKVADIIVAMSNKRPRIEAGAGPPAAAAAQAVQPSPQTVSGIDANPQTASSSAHTSSEPEDSESEAESEESAEGEDDLEEEEATEETPPAAQAATVPTTWSRKEMIAKMRARDAKKKARTTTS